MISPAVRTTFRVTLLAVFQRLAIAGPVLWAATWVAVTYHPPARSAELDTAVWWLHLPTLGLAVLTIAATVEAWPAFGRDRRITTGVARFRVGAMEGCGVAAAAALCALAPALAISGAAFEWARGTSDQQVHRVERLTVEGIPILDERIDRVRARRRGSFPMRTVRVRAGAFWPDDGQIRPTAISIDVPGTEGATPETVSQPGQLVERRLANASTATEILIRRHGDAGLGLHFPPGAIEVVGDAARSRGWNGVLAALWTWVATAAGFALALLGRRSLSATVLTLTAGGAAVGLTAVDLAPNAWAIAEHARDRWSDRANDCAFWSLSATFAAMLFGVLLGRKAQSEQRQRA